MVLPARILSDMAADERWYPDSDGKPLGETDYHIAAILLLRQVLQDSYADSPKVYVASDLFWYYEEGNNRARVAPDTMVVKGVPKHFRRVFLGWVERAVPSVIFEVTSWKTWRLDLGKKKDLYERLAVKEYFVFDPEARYVIPPLQGWRLEKGKYVPLRPDRQGRLTSRELGFKLAREDYRLRFFDALTGARIPTPEERLRATQEELERTKKELARLKRRRK